MVCSGHPECLIALHSLETYQDILKGIVKGMSHMKLSCDIWRRHYDRKRFLTAIYLRMEIFFLLPFVISSFLNIRRIVVFLQFFFHCLTSFLLIIYKIICFIITWQSFKAP